MREINQLKLTNNSQLLQKFKTNIATAKEAEPSMLTRGGGLDSVTFSSAPAVTEPKGESYVDVLNEFSQKYGEGRSLEQAKLGVEYMTRLLACEDLPEERRVEFENQKVCYEMMVIEFENWDKARDGKQESILDIQKELDDFMYKYQESNRKFASERERLGYQHEYVQVIHSFYQRMYDCELTPGQKAELDKLVEQNLNEFNNICDELKNLNKPQTENYQDILEEFCNAYGEGRSLEQAKLGIEYMNRLLACEDLPPQTRANFEAKKKGYEMMLAEFENYEKMGSGEKVADVWKELENFVAQYKKNPEGASYGEGTAYWLAYHESCMSFYRRLLQCDDLTDDLKAEYNRMIQEYRSDKDRIINELNDRNGINSRNNLIEQGLTDEVIDKYFSLMTNAETGVSTYMPKGMGNFKYTIEQKNGTVQLRIFDIHGEQTRYVVIQDGEVKIDIDTKNTQKQENTTETERTEKDKSQKITGGTYGSLLSMGFTPALIQRYFDAPDPNAPANSLEKFTYTLKENIEVLPGSGAYITSVDELVEILKQYGIIK